MKFEAFSDAYQNARKALVSKEATEIKATLQQTREILRGFRWSQFNVIDQRYIWTYLETLSASILEYSADIFDPEFTVFLKETRDAFDALKQQSTLNTWRVHQHLLKEATSEADILYHVKKITVYACDKVGQGVYEKNIFEHLLSEIPRLKNSDQSSIVLKIEKTLKSMRPTEPAARQALIELQMILAHLYYVVRSKKSKEQLSQFENYEPLSSFAFSESIRCFNETNTDLRELAQHYTTQARSLPQPLKLLLQDQLYYFLIHNKKLTVTTLLECSETCSSEAKQWLQEFAFMHPRAPHYEALVRFVALAFQEQADLTAKGLEKFLIHQAAFRPFKRLFNYNHTSFSPMTLPLQMGIKSLSEDDYANLSKASKTLPHFNTFFQKSVQEVEGKPSVTPSSKTSELLKEANVCLEKFMALYRRKNRLEQINMVFDASNIDTLYTQVQKLKHILQDSEKKKKCPNAWSFLNDTFSFLERQGFSCQSARLLMAEYLKNEDRTQAAIDMLHPYRESPAVRLEIVSLLYLTRNYLSMEHALNQLNGNKDSEAAVENWRKKIQEDLAKREKELSEIIEIRKNKASSVEEIARTLKTIYSLLSRFPLDEIFKARLLHEKIALEFSRIQKEGVNFYTESDTMCSVTIDLKVLETLTETLQQEVIPNHPTKDEPLYTLAKIYYFCAKAFEIGKITNVIRLSTPEDQKKFSYIQNVQYGEAIRHLTAVLNYRKKHAEAQWVLADIYNQLLQYDKAERIYRILIKEKIGEQDALIKMFALCFQLERYDEAYEHAKSLINILESAGKNQSDSTFNESITLTTLYYFAGSTAEILDKKSEAAAYFKKAKLQFEIGPHFDSLSGHLTILYCKTKKFMQNVTPISTHEGALIALCQGEYYFRDYIRDPLTRTHSFGEPIKLENLKSLFSEYMLPVLNEGYINFSTFLRTPLLYRALLDAVGAKSVYFRTLRDKFLIDVQQHEKNSFSSLIKHSILTQPKVIGDSADNRASLKTEDDDGKDESRSSKCTTL